MAPLEWWEATTQVLFTMQACGRKADEIVGEGMIPFSWEEQRQLWLLCSKDGSGIHGRESALGFGSLGS